MKRILPLLLALLLCLSACGKTRIVPTETAEPAQTPETEPALDTELFDWDAAYAAYEPDTVVFTVEGREATWQELFYQVAYCTAALEYSSGVTITDWDMEMTDAQGNTVSCGDYVLQAAVAMLQQYHIVYNELTALGVTLEEEDRAELEAYEKQLLEEGYAGDEEAFRADLESLFCSEELWHWFNEVDALYNAGFRHFYGSMGELYGEEETLAYGEEYGYVNTRQLYIYNNSDGTSEEPAGDTAEDFAGMGRLLSELEAVKEDPAALEERFVELFEQYNEDLALENYPDGWCIWQGDTDESVYQAAMAMEDHSYTVVETEAADVLVLRLPLAADAPVFYDAYEDVSYPLSYYAAWQDYSDLVNGPGGWIQSAETLPAAEFEDFRLRDVF